VVAVAYLFLWDDHFLDPVPIPWGLEEEDEKDAQSLETLTSKVCGLDRRERGREGGEGRGVVCEEVRLVRGAVGPTLYLCAWV
jgi:hypothetical protein